VIDLSVGCALGAWMAAVSAVPGDGSRLPARRAERQPNRRGPDSAPIVALLRPSKPKEHAPYGCYAQDEYPDEPLMR
jgi:hypothetical protein